MLSGTPTRHLPARANGGGGETGLLPFLPSWGGLFQGGREGHRVYSVQPTRGFGTAEENVYFGQQ